MKKRSSRILGCLFGSGNLPNLLINNLKQNREKFVVVYIRPLSKLVGKRRSMKVADAQHTTELFATVGEVGKILNFLRQNGVTDVVLAGKVERPSFSEIKFDTGGALLFAKLGLKILEVLKGGDDYVISYIMHVLKKEGYRIISPESLMSELLAPAGILTKRGPTAQDNQDILIGKSVLACIGRYDVGQAIIIEESRVLGIEGAEGTDQLILRCAKLKKKPRGGVLVKMKKLGQETRTDLPAIGLQTVLNAHKAGLNGIAFEVNASLIIDIKKVIAKANTYRMFLEGIECQ